MIWGYPYFRKPTDSHGGYPNVAGFFWFQGVVSFFFVFLDDTPYFRKPPFLALRCMDSINHVMIGVITQVWSIYLAKLRRPHCRRTLKIWWLYKGIVLKWLQVSGYWISQFATREREVSWFPKMGVSPSHHCFQYWNGLVTSNFEDFSFLETPTL